MKFTLLLLVLTCLFTSCSNRDNHRDKIVEHIKQLSVPQETLTRYKINDFSNIETLVKVEPDYFSERGNGKGDIWVYATHDNLLIFIEEEDLGHAGEFGVVYSNNDSLPVWNEDEWGERWTIDKKIGEHWWKISYRLG